MPLARLTKKMTMMMWIRQHDSSSLSALRSQKKHSETVLENKQNQAVTILSRKKSRQLASKVQLHARQFKKRQIDQKRLARTKPYRLLTLIKYLSFIS